MSFKNLSDCYTLSNGVGVPCIGYGTYKTPDGDECISGVMSALKTGYRHIDTAAFYMNEKSVGEGMRRSGIPRKDVFVTTKVWNDMQGYDNTLRAFDTSLKNLGLDTVDLYLVHWPNPAAFRDSYPERFLNTWRAMEQLYKDGQVRAIGVCNSLKHHLNCLFEECEIKPQVNQIEFHAGFTQPETERFSKENGLLVEAWAPLCKGRFFGLEPLASIARKYCKSEAQVLVRWCMQHGVLPLPKSVTPKRIEENADVFDFVLSNEDMSGIDGFDACARLGSHPDKADF